MSATAASAMAPPAPARFALAGLKRRNCAGSSAAACLRDMLLVLPLIAFLFLVFVGPICMFVYRAVDNSIVPRNLPRTVAAIASWSPPEPPPEAVYEALAADLRSIPAGGTAAVLGRYLNANREGFRSLIIKTANNLPADPTG